MSDEIKLWRIGTPGFGSNPFAKDWAIGEGQTLEDAVLFAIEDAGLEADVADYTSNSAPLVFGGYVVETYDHSGGFDIGAMGDERALVWCDDGYLVYSKAVPRGPKFKPGQWIRHVATGVVFRVETFEWWNDEKGYIYRGVTSPHDGNGTRWEQGDEGDVELTDDPTPPHKKPPVEVCRVEEDGSSAILLQYEGGGYTLAYEPIMFSRGARNDIGELIEEERRRLRERIELLGKLKVKAGAAGREQAMAAMLFGHDTDEPHDTRTANGSTSDMGANDGSALSIDIKTERLPDECPKGSTLFVRNGQGFYQWDAFPENCDGTWHSEGLNRYVPGEEMYGPWFLLTLPGEDYPKHCRCPIEKAKQLLGVRKLELEPKIEGKGQITLGENTWRTLIKLDEQGHIELLDGELRYWRIDDGERHWVKAATRTDAVLVYVRACEPDWVHDRSCDPPEVVELDPSDPIEVGEDDGPEMKVRKGPIGEVFADDPTGLLCSTVW